MPIDTLNWKLLEKTILDVCMRSMHHIETHPSSSPIYAFGMEANIEEASIFLSANTAGSRKEATEWWIPDWEILYINEKVEDDSTRSVFAEFYDQFEQIIEDDETGEEYEELCRMFRLACLRSLRKISSTQSPVAFPTTDDFTFVYMDSTGELYRSIDSMTSCIQTLEDTTKR